MCCFAFFTKKKQKKNPIPRTTSAHDLFFHAPSSILNLARFPLAATATAAAVVAK
jgi:hypothetical protein